MKKILNNIIKTLLPLLLGAFILIWLYRDFDFSKLLEGLKEMNWWWFLLSIVFIVLSHAIRGWRWKLALSPLGYNPHSTTCVDSIFIAYGANLVIPRIGEVSRCAVLDRYEKVPFVHSLGTVVSERIIDSIMVAGMTIMAIALQWNIFATFFNEANSNNDNSTSATAGLAIIIVSLLAVATLLLFLLRKMSIWSKLKSFIARFWEGMTTLAKIKNLKLFILETVGIWFCYFMQFYLCFFCFPFSSNLSIFAAFLMFVAGSIAVIVPTPNGAGPWHFVVASLMMLYGVESDDAQMFALIVHSLQTLIVALLGVYGWIRLQFIK
ncbi:MAG: flippase-like domain-containing protein [Bacteroidaceae bacterium]|nr:flippase-like domain-containing protein [Bacteroidaceae bacterium]